MEMLRRSFHTETALPNTATFPQNAPHLLKLLFNPMTYNAMLKQMDQRRFISDPVGKCLRTEAIVESGKTKTTPINRLLERSSTWDVCSKGRSLENLFSRTQAVEGFLIWLAGIDRDPEHDPSVTHHVELAAQRWLQVAPRYTFSKPHPVWVDAGTGIVRQDDPSGRHAYAFLQDVEYCLFRKEGRRFFRCAPSDQTKPNSPSRLDPQDAKREAVKADTSKPTTTSSVVDARIGQEKFRQALLRLWKSCSVTGCGDERLLRAAHIKPWSESTDTERLDKYNGFLLTPGLDLAFDQGLISFTDAGEILMRPGLSREDARKAGIDRSMSLLRIYPENRPYLAFHRQLHGFTTMAFDDEEIAASEIQI